MLCPTKRNFVKGKLLGARLLPKSFTRPIHHYLHGTLCISIFYLL
uniref:Uncharacterized protein n=1 Tax=Meloidogyne enterolobii TaxID=390850 RepID=A0A6V7XAR6_MELEN|nr:unnamed protein product [Meloidogyne enterolobii]